LGARVDRALLEHVKVLGVFQVHQLLQRVLQGTLLLAVEAALLEVVDGHEDACEVGHLAQLLGRGLLGLALQLALLILDVLEPLLQLCDVIIQLHDLGIHVLLVLGHRVLQVLQLLLQGLHVLRQLIVGILQRRVPRQDVLELLILVGVAIPDALEVGLILLHGLDLKVDAVLLVLEDLILLLLLVYLLLEDLYLVALIRPLFIRLTLLLLVVLQELRELNHLILEFEVGCAEVGLLLTELILFPDNNLD
jgi:hypothetical protein